jgi:choline dehydrogenase-like flavoprotein
MAFDSFLDARKIEEDTELSSQVCIVGAGAAGITIALELIEAGIDVCLLEAGGLSIDPRVDTLSVIENVGRDYPANRSRLRFFGGTTNHWGGHCVPLRESDLQQHDWMAHTAWPFQYDELRPYYQRAHDQLGIGPFDYDPKAGAAELGSAKMLPFDGQRIESTMSRYKRVRFGLTYGDKLAASPHLRCVLYADVTAFDLDAAEGETVTAVRVRSVAGNRFTVRARYFVLACGGIENARVLLASNHQRPAGLGNHADMAGRYFTEHIWFESGYIVPKIPIAAYRHYVEEVPSKESGVRFHIAVASHAQEELRIPAFRAELHANSAAYWEGKGVRIHGATLSALAELLSDPFALGHAIRCRRDAQPDMFVLVNYVEQTPNPESRVTLSDKRDALGRPNARLNWRLQSIDKEGILRAHELLAREVGRAGAGRMHLGLHDGQEIEVGAAGGSHHMGTTRMHENPKQGVTDAHGRVHYTRNLYAAGSSLFPSCGYSNPTLTIVATSFRVADAIKGRVRQDGGA